VKREPAIAGSHFDCWVFGSGSDQKMRIKIRISRIRPPMLIYITHLPDT
jgi:hypothetical protein